MRLPILLMVFAGFKVIKFDGFGFFIDIDMVNFAGDGGRIQG